MYIKILQISMLLHIFSLVAQESYKKTWLSGVEKLDTLEIQKFNKLCQEIGCCCKNVFDDKFCEKMKPCITRWSKKYEQLVVDSSDKNVKNVKKQSASFLKKMQQDKEISLLAKNLVEFFDSYMNECIDPKNNAYQNLLDILCHYFPEKADFNQIYLDYLVSNYDYLHVKLHKKSGLKIEDFSYVLEQFMYAIKENVQFSALFSLKKSYYMWTSFVNAVEKGMKAQPKDVQKYFIKKVEKVIQDSDFKACMDSIKSIRSVRKEILKTANKSVDIAKLREYETLLDKAIDQIGAVVATHVGKKNPEAKFYTMTEKLVFVS